MYCPSCGSKMKQDKSKDFPFGTTTLFTCSSCDSKLVEEYDSFQQETTLYPLEE